KNMKDVTDVTIYTFLFPLARIHPNAERHARAIWCAEDRAAAWTSWMQEKKEPEAKTCDGDPIEALHALAEKLNIAGTPTLYFATGRRVSHGLSAEDLEQALKESVKTAAAHQANALPTASCMAPRASSPAPDCGTPK